MSDDGLLPTKRAVHQSNPEALFKVSFFFRTRPKSLLQRLGTKFGDLTSVILVAVATIFTSLPARDAQAQSVDPLALMERNYVASKVVDSTATVEFRLVNSSGQQRVRLTTTISRLKEGSLDNMRLTRFTEPADIRGTGTLTIENSAGDDDIWIYLPALKRTRRVVAANKADSYVGTDFSYGDIIGYDAADWTHTIIGNDTVDGQNCAVVESVPAGPEILEQSGYSKRISWVRLDNAVTLKGEFYDPAGVLLKTLAVEDVREVDPANGRWQAMHFEMRNVQTGHRTEIIFTDFKANVGVDPGLFVPRTLERNE
jgi:hypothetical protein